MEAATNMASSSRHSATAPAAPGLKPVHFEAGAFCCTQARPCSASRGWLRAPVQQLALLSTRQVLPQLHAREG